MPPDPKKKRIRDGEAAKRKLAVDPNCRSCRSRATDGHHVVLRSQLGDDVEDNIVPLCHDHHMAYHSGKGSIHLTYLESLYVADKFGTGARDYARKRRLIMELTAEPLWRGHES